MSPTLIAEAVGLGLVATVSPLTLMAVYPTLAGQRGVRRAAVIVTAWLCGLILVAAGALITLATAAADDPGQTADPARWLDVLRVVAGGLLIAIAARKVLRRRMPGYEVKEPAWISSLNEASVVRLATIGLLLAVANVKIWALGVSLAAAAASEDLASAELLMLALLFAGVGTLGSGIPTLAAAIAGERAGQALDRLRRWVTHNEAYLVAGVLVLIGWAVLKQGLDGW